MIKTALLIFAASLIVMSGSVGAILGTAYIIGEIRNKFFPRKD